jgi:hypothetical protein
VNDPGVRQGVSSDPGGDREYDEEHDTGSGFANALNQLHFLYLDTPHRAARHDGRHSCLNFLHCRSNVDIAELQRDLYQDTLKGAAGVSTSASKIIR